MDGAAHELADHIHAGHRAVRKGAFSDDALDGGLESGEVLLHFRSEGFHDRLGGGEFLRGVKIGPQLALDACSVVWIKKVARLPLAA